MKDSADQANQGSHPLDEMASIAGEVVGNIAQRVEIDGIPDEFAHTLAGLLSAYLLPVMMRRRVITPADALVVMDLVHTARVAVVGPQPQLFRDKVATALIGAQHVGEVFRRGIEAQRVQKEAAERQEPSAEEVAGHIMREVAKLDPLPPEPDFEEAATRESVADFINEAPHRSQSLAEAIQYDRALVDDPQLIRWILDPGADVWADLLRQEDNDDRRERRPSVAPSMVRARIERLESLLAKQPPSGVSSAEWTAASNRVLPLKGDTRDSIDKAAGIVAKAA